MRQLSIILLLSTLWISGSPVLAAPLAQSYDDRPHIFEITPEKTEFDEKWESIKKGQLIFLAQVLELYPDKQIYFLARDGEYLFDLAQLATKGTKDFERIHLINVSRANMRERNFVEYLRQNGISEESLLSGKEILLIDSGYNGSIPDHIKFQFSEAASKNIHAQFILSKDPSIPSSRAFLLFLNAKAHRLNPQTSVELKNDLLAYEKLEKETRRSTHFKEIDGILHPMSPLKDAKAQSSSFADKIVAAMQASENRMVDPSMALMRRADLKAHWSEADNQRFFNQTRSHIKIIRQALISGKTDRLLDQLHHEHQDQKKLTQAYMIDAHHILKSQKFKLSNTVMHLLNPRSKSPLPHCREIFR